MVRGKTVLVTGGAGFIGSRLVDRLIEEEYRVVVVDNLSTGKLKNLNAAATLHHVDITDPMVGEVFQREQPDLVFHLAAQTSVGQSMRDPVKDCEINVLGTCGFWRPPATAASKSLYSPLPVGPSTATRRATPARKTAQSSPFHPTACPSTRANCNWNCTGASI